MCEQTCVQYCKVATVGDLTDALEELDITDSKESKTVCLNIEKKAKYRKDEATAIDLVFKSLSDDDQALYDGYERAWAYLQKNYSKTDATTAITYLTNIQAFEFDNNSTIMGSWDKLKGYRRKLGAADANAKSTYNDAALLLVLTRITS